MNQLLKELAKQADEYASQFAHLGAIDHPSHIDKFNQKFAELIVKECADYVNWYQANGRYTNYAEAIKKYFGVEK